MKPAPHLQLLPPLAAPAAAGADDELGARAQEGDLAAWAEVYARHYGRLLRQLRHLTGRPRGRRGAGAGDLRAGDGEPGRYEPGRSLEAWLAGIALNMARKHWRSRQSAEKAHARLCCVAELHGAGPALDRLHLQRERSRVLYAVLAELPEPLREAFTVRELEGMSTEEAATCWPSRPATSRCGSAGPGPGSALRCAPWVGCRAREGAREPRTRVSGGGAAIDGAGGRGARRRRARAGRRGARPDFAEIVARAHRIDPKAVPYGWIDAARRGAPARPTGPFAADPGRRW
jgi:RNA polymerase sigma-70 factor (ECF subfamily)